MGDPIGTLDAVYSNSCDRGRIESYNHTSNLTQKTHDELNDWRLYSFPLVVHSSREVGVGKGLNVKGKQGAPVMSCLGPGLLDGMLLTPFCNRSFCWDGIENVKNVCMMWVADVSSTCHYFIFGHGDLKVFFDAVFCAKHFCFKMHSYLFDKNSPAPLTARPLLRSAKKNRLSGFVPFVQISQHLSTEAELPNSQPFRGVWL